MIDAQLADELEAWIERGVVWDPVELDRFAARLTDAGSPAGDLAHTFAALRLRLEMGAVDGWLQRDVEAVLYPRLWKIIEAVRDELPVREQRTRIQVLNRRLARLFVTEDPPAPA